MKKKDIKDIWKDYSTRLQTDLNVNHPAFKNENLKKTRLTLRKLIYRRAIESVLFLIIVKLFFSFALNNYPIPQYVLSGVIIGIFYLVGFIGSIGQIILIIKLDYSNPITALQLKLEKLKTHSLKTLRLFILQIPFAFLAYPIIGFKVFANFDIWTHGDSKWLILNIILSIVFIPFSVWIYKKFSYKTESKWVKNLITDNGGIQINSAIQFINEIEEFKKDYSSEYLSNED